MNVSYEGRRLAHALQSVRYGMTQTWISRCVCVAVAVAIMVVFGQTVTFDFVSYDDYSYVLENGKVRQGITWKGIAWAAQTTFHRHWHPLTWLSHMLDVALFGLNPAGHHLVNLLIHIVNSVFLYFIVLRITRAQYVSAAMAMLFAVHPLHVETIAWVADRKDLLAAFFWFLTFWAYIHYCKTPSVKRYMCVVMFMVLGVLCKSSIFTLPFALLLFDYWPLGRLEWGQATCAIEADIPKWGPLMLMIEKVPLFLLSAAAIAVARIAMDTADQGLVEGHRPVASLFTTTHALCSYMTYFAKTLWPYPLAVPYSHPKWDPWAQWQMVTALFFTLGVTWVSIWQGRRRPFLIVGWFFFLGNLLPVIGFFTMGPMRMADRYTYIPLLGLFFMIVFYVREQVGQHRIPVTAVKAISSCALLALMVVAFIQVRHWENSFTLFANTLRVTQKNALAHNNFGNEYARQGKLKEAVRHYKQALSIRPTYVNALVNIGVLLQREGRLDEASAFHRQALTNRPDYAPAHFNMGWALEQEGRYDDAEYHYRRAVTLMPDYQQAHSSLGVLMTRMGRYPEAIKQIQVLIKLMPHDPKILNNMGGVLQQIGDIKAAERYYEKTLSIDEDNVSALYNLASIHELEGSVNQAEREFHQLLALNPSSAEAYLGLGRIAENRGDLKKALSCYQAALNLKQNFQPARRNIDRVTSKLEQMSQYFKGNIPE